MQGYAIKIQQLEREIAEYSNYDWETFSKLTFKEKIAEYLKVHKILLMMKRSKHFYFQHFAIIINDSAVKRRKKHVGRKIFQLGKLIDILECVANQMELQIVLLK